MPKTFIKKIAKKPGLAPGTLVHIGEQKIEKAKITIFDYNEHECSVTEIEKIEECFAYKDRSTFKWINIDGLHDLDIIKKIGDCYGLHPLLLEDIVHADQRPKIEDYGDYLYIVLKMIRFDEQEDEIIAEQISIIVGERFVISFQESLGDVFNPVRERLKNGKGRLRALGTDYLAYSLMDAIIDHYFIILEKTSEIIADLEEELVTEPNPETLQQIHELKREMVFLRKAVWPLREVISILERGESLIIKETTKIYLRDLYDHSIQIIETLEAYRDIVSGMIDIYLSSISNKMNEIMKVLTIIATIFIPLTFIAGIYGMNFKYMPELEWHWGYPFIWLIVIIISISMLLYFRSKKWL